MAVRPIVPRQTKSVAPDCFKVCSPSCHLRAINQMVSLTLQTTLNQVVSLSHHVMAPCTGMRCEASVTLLNGKVHVLFDLMDVAHVLVKGHHDCDSEYCTPLKCKQWLSQYTLHDIWNISGRPFRIIQHFSLISNRKTGLKWSCDYFRKRDETNICIQQK